MSKRPRELTSRSDKSPTMKAGEKKLSNILLPISLSHPTHQTLKLFESSPRPYGSNTATLQQALHESAVLRGRREECPQSPLRRQAQKRPADKSAGLNSYWLNAS